jgi:hypothetical protein
MNNKLKKLAVNLSELISKSDTPQQVYDGLIPVMQKQSDYFKYLGPDNIVKLTLYLYSFKTTGKFNVGETMIWSLGFANLITTEGNEYVEVCDDCGGEGETDCPLCYRGEIECTTCNGSKEISCPECDGELEDCEECDGRGEISCPECGGDGTNSCNSCNNGNEWCWNCSGSGEIETDEVKYDTYFVATWNRDINRDFSLNENSKYPALSDNEFDRLRDEYIVLTYEDDGHAEFQGWVRTNNEIYCTFYSDEPKLNLTETMRVDNRADSYEPDYYTK